MPGRRYLWAVSAGIVSCASVAACPTITGYPNSKGWQKGTDPATIYISSALTSTQQANVMTAFNNWNSAAASNVTFVQSTVSSLPAQPKQPYIFVAFGSTSGCGTGKSACTQFQTAGGGYTSSGTITLDQNAVNAMGNAFLPTMAHEVGHTYALQECDGCGSQTIMDGSNITASSPTTPTACDLAAVATVSQGSYGNSGGGGNGGGTACTGGCPGTEPICENSEAVCNTNTCQWSCADGAPGCYPPAPAPCCNDCYVVCEVGGYACIGSPIVIDTAGVGFHFTTVPDGVRFRVLPGQDQHQMSWPEASFSNGWLALDRDGDGEINDFTELFGNATPQPATAHPNGYLALAVFDDPANGGNGNGVIDPGDAVFSRLRIWIDQNHNGISEPNELYTLPEIGIFRIDLDYYLEWYVDENGNVYRYKSRMWDQVGHDDHVCYDVFVHISYN